MIGAILAAGVGSRLRPLTSAKPKCLVTAHGKAILDYQLDSYRQAGITEVYIVSGYESQALVNHLRHVNDLQITIVDNPDFESTNNMYSLNLLRTHLEGRAFVLNNADLAIDPQIVPALVNDPRPDLIAVDTSVFDEESMKVTVREDGTISDISKIITEDIAYACSIDFYKFSPESSTILFDHIRDVIEVEQNLQRWTEVALQSLNRAQELSMQPLDIAGLDWVEIDNYQDLATADILFSKFDLSLGDVDTIFLDLDGTVLLGDTPIAGADGFVERARQAGKRVYFLSNNSSKSKAEYVKKVALAGITAEESDFVLSTDGVIEYLKQQKTRGVFVLGTASLRSAFEAAGIPIDEDAAEHVVVGYDTELTYAKLRRAAELLHQGADFLATHPDVTCPTENGPIPDVGAITEMLRLTSGISPTKVFGKPQREMIAHLIPGGAVDRTVVIGDRIYTDTLLAQNVGTKSVLVLSGEATRDDVEGLSRIPHVVVPSVADLLPG